MVPAALPDVLLKSPDDSMSHADTCVSGAVDVAVGHRTCILTFALGFCLYMHGFHHDSP